MFFPTEMSQQHFDPDRLKQIVSLAVRGAGFEALLDSLLQPAHGLAGAHPRAAI